MSQSVVIENILWAGTTGGAIFSGSVVDGTKYRFVASSAVMPRAPISGEVWSITGTRRRDPQYGAQVEATQCMLERPSGRLITKVLASSKTFPGVGAVTARRLWEKFGEKLYGHLDAGDLAIFTPIIGCDLAAVLVTGWREMTIEADVYRWLDSHGVPIWIAKKLMAIYGNEVVEKLEENPYRLLAFTSWLEADLVGRGTGIAPNDDRRLVAAADAAVYARLNSRHTWTRKAGFEQLLSKFLGPQVPSPTESIRLALGDMAVVEVEDGVQGLGPYSMEVFIASKMAEIVRGDFQSSQMTIRQEPDPARTESMLADHERAKGITLNPMQRAAVHLALTAPLGAISGGAGVGKTTVLSAICAITETLGGHVHQLALSGRAARRMEEATARPAQTIASWLRAVDAGTVPLDTEPTIAIDESSMLDLPTMYRILRRLQPGCRLLLLGDPGQLPPIGFGIVFHAMVQEATIPRVHLTEIMRQAASTGIPQASCEIREGRVPPFREYQGRCDGITFIDCDRDKIVDTVLDVVNDLGGVAKCKVVSATKNGPAGVNAINHAFHELLSPGKPRLHGYAVGEPVIWLRNDYDLDLLNGSLGTIVRADTELRINWESVGEAVVEPAFLDNMNLAYGITVHKSQGSQFPTVVVPLYRSRLLDRTLLYTAVTRAQSQVVLVGDRGAFRRAVIAPPNPSLRQTAMHVHLAKARL